MNFQQHVLHDGFAIIPNAFSIGDVATIAEAVTQLGLRRSRAGARHILSYPPVETVARTPQMLTIAREILGPEAFPFRVTLFDKSQTANWLVVWHQDTALPLSHCCDTPGWGPWSIKNGMHYAHAPAEALEQVLALRLHLDDSSSRNGPLRVLPSTHNKGVLSDDQIHDLAAQILPIECVVPAGGILAIRPLVVHASSKSQTAAPRRVLHFEYAASRSIAKPLELAVA